MPARPLSDDTLQLIDAVRAALLEAGEVEEKRMFGCHVFMVNGKLCLGVEGDELLVRLIAARREETERALIAVRWGAPCEEERDSRDRTRRGPLVLIALALLSAASALWIGWALAAHVGELWQAAEAAMDRGAM